MKSTPERSSALDFLRSREIAILAVFVALGASACGGEKPRESDKAQPQESTSPMIPSGDVKVYYFDDGSRFLKPDFGKPSKSSGNYSGILEWCDGGNLLMVGSLEETGTNGGVSSIAVSPNSNKCDDGILTRDDFDKKTSPIEVVIR